MRTLVRVLNTAVVLLAAALLSPLHAQTQAPPQAQQNRIALVIGNGNYQAAPLATAANDAGLVAQTLQAAGFDVVGARDLDGETLRRTFSDFLQKAKTAGPDTVAVVYLAGYGLQLAGENYFAPVDAAMTRDTDVPVEGLRIGDYIRQLAALPLKANVTVLDIAYNSPFAKDGQPLAGGLALMEPDPKGLIAFNAAPGTVAPTPSGNYGPYAQALAEMIRTGGIGLPEIFNRVRLRVNDVTKGAEVPWDANKLEGEFMFFERAPDAPPVQADQDAAARSKPIRDFSSAQDAYTAALERDTLGGYEEFLAAYPDDPMAKRVRAIVAARREAVTWRQTYRANTQQSYWSYLKRYPKGPHAADARRRLNAIAAAQEPPAAFDAYAYDVPPPQDYEFEYVDRPYLMFDDPAFAFAPPPPPPLFFLPPVPDDFVSLDAPIYYDDPYYLPQPIFVPIPVFIRPPLFVRPPVNRFLFNNIHNREVISNIINRRPPPAGGAGPGGQARPGGAGIAAVSRPAFAPGLPAFAARKGNLIRQGRVTAPAGVLPGAAGRGRPGRGPQPAAAPNNLPAANVLPGQSPAGRAGGRPLPNAVTAPGATGPQPGTGRPGRFDRTPAAGSAGPSVQPGAVAPTARPAARPQRPAAQPRPQFQRPVAAPRPQIAPRPQVQRPQFQRPVAAPRPQFAPRPQPQFQRPAMAPRPQMAPPPRPAMVAPRPQMAPRPAMPPRPAMAPRPAPRAPPAKPVKPPG